MTAPDISPEAVESVLRGSSFGIDRNHVLAMLRELRSSLTASGERIRALQRMMGPIQRASILRDHFTACDRTMGDSHPCTCGMDKYRQLLSELK